MKKSSKRQGVAQHSHPLEEEISGSRMEGPGHLPRSADDIVATERALIMVQERSQRSKLGASVGTEVGKQFKETDGRKMRNEPGSSI